MSKTTILPIKTPVLFRVPGEIKEQHGKVYNYDVMTHLYKIQYDRNKNEHAFVSQLNIIAYW